MLATFPPVSGEQKMLVIDYPVDGDTIDMAFLVPVRCRVFGINTPEMRPRLRDANGRERSKAERDAERAAAIAAQAYLKKIMPVGTLATVKVEGKDSLGRTLADIYMRAHGGTSLGEHLIQQGHGKAFLP